VAAQGIEGPAVEGEFVAVTATAVTVRTRSGPTGATADLPLAGMRDLTFKAEAPQAAAKDRLRVTLTSGEELVADGWGPAPDGLKLESPAFGALRVPLEAVRWIVPVPAKAGTCHNPAGRMLPRAGADVVWLIGGDEIAGTVAQATAEGLVVELERGRSRTVAWGDLLVASVDNPDAKAAAGAHAEVETHGGDLLRAAGALTGDAAGGLSLTLQADGSLAARVPTAAVRTVRWRGGRCVDATSLAFTAVYRSLAGYAPGSFSDRSLERARGVRVGRRPSGCPLRLDGTLHRHGWSVHSGSEVRLPLGAGFKTFHARFGIDDEAREEAAAEVEVAGDVDTRVLGDGKVLWEAKGVTGADRSRTVGPLDVSGVKELVLVVDYGGHDETLDRATWAEPLLLR
jgi:hypothetical protein